MYCFSQFCRLCFRRDCKVIHLNTKDDDTITFSEKLKSCIPEIMCDEDSIPNVICDNCCIKLRKGYEFKTMCVKNHIALRDYAKQLLKYMENPTNSPYFFNIKKNKFEKPDDANKNYDSDRSDCSDDSSDNRLYIKEEDEPESQENPENDSNEPKDDQPLALVKGDRKNDGRNGENSYNPFMSFVNKKDPEVPTKKVKVEDTSDDENDYECQDLRKKSTSETIPNVFSTDRNTQRDFVPNYSNMTNDMVMKYLKLEYADKEENRQNETKPPPVTRPENLSTAESETEQDEACSWNTAVNQEPSKKMKTRTKDKYRIVYTETQRLELEKEFIVSRYITTSRKMQLSTSLNLSQRQIKIWFQNRRAKERKQVKRTAEQLSDPLSGDVLGERSSSAEPKNIPLQSLTSNEIMSQMSEVQREMFLLQRQQESLLQQQKDSKSNFDDLLKNKNDMLIQRLEVLQQQQKHLSSTNGNQSDASSN